MNLIDRLRFYSVDDEILCEAADALEALRGYARHKLGCEMLDPERPFWTCTCGLDDLLAKLGGE